MTSELRTQRVFAPLDPDERLPRELLSESSPVRVIRDDPGWRNLASFVWPAALLVVLGAVMWQYNDAGMALGAVAIAFLAFGWFIFHRRR
jgi:hypothetical protein